MKSLKIHKHLIEIDSKILSINKTNSCFEFYKTNSFQIFDLVVFIMIDSLHLHFRPPGLYQGSYQALVQV